jgi:hypothetical protein
MEKRKVYKQLASALDAYIRCVSSDRNGFKEYAYELFQSALSESTDEKERN